MDPIVVGCVCTPKTAERDEITDHSKRALRGHTDVKFRRFGWSKLNRYCGGAVTQSFATCVPRGVRVRRKKG
jgi:hypothetical protein